MYNSPIDKIIGEMQSQLVKNEEGQLMVQVTQTVGYDIDKDELIKALNYDRQQYEKGYEDGLNANRWIPVSERLPEEKQAVLVWCHQYKNIYCAYLEKKQWWIFGAFVQIVPSEVVAWMPLPKPFNAESEDK